MGALQTGTHRPRTRQRGRLIESRWGPGRTRWRPRATTDIAAVFLKTWRGQRVWRGGVRSGGASADRLGHWAPPPPLPCWEQLQPRGPLLQQSKSSSGETWGGGEGMRAPVKAEQVLRDSGPHRKPQAKDPVLRGGLINPGKSVGRTHSWTPRRLADGGGGCERGEGDGFWGIGLSICKGNSGRSPVKISIPPHQ